MKMMNLLLNPTQIKFQFGAPYRLVETTETVKYFPNNSGDASTFRLRTRK